MRAGRLVELLLLLQHRGRMTATQLAEELEVSRRTIIRDVESLSGAGVPVRAIRGREGGFELLEGYESGLAGPAGWSRSQQGRVSRAQVWISQDGRRLAAVLGRLQPIRVRGVEPADERGWERASFRIWSVQAAAHDVLSLGAEVEVISPPDLRERVAALAAGVAGLYDG